MQKVFKVCKARKSTFDFWADEDYDEEFVLGCQSWEHSESGHSQTGMNELNYILGRGHDFETVKPLKLIEKVIQLWCPKMAWLWILLQVREQRGMLF